MPTYDPRWVIRAGMAAKSGSSAGSDGVKAKRQTQSGWLASGNSVTETPSPSARAEMATFSTSAPWPSSEARWR